ncbi:hypothetical protein O7598_24215 [Micromonospora sp. WMMC241]|nr:hypothetical protein [Micromonospora sp. WMMC241]MCZ7439530.1 hypothetical protein [Micromonospora sp. WMMC241]
MSAALADFPARTPVTDGSPPAVRAHVPERRPPDPLCGGRASGSGAGAAR